MQITFDPLKYDEQQAVAKLLEALGVFGEAETMTIQVPAPTVDEIQRFVREHSDTRSVAERALDANADETTIPPAPAVSAVPLPPVAPSPAAADLFSTAPVVPPAGVPMPPTDAAPPVPPAPLTAVPSAPAAPANPAGGAELDKHGLPWDARIHSGTKAVNADGSWRARRGLNDQALVSRVETELRALMALPGGVPLAVTAPFAEATGSAVSIPTPPAPTTLAPPIAATPTPPVPPAPTAAAPSVPATGGPNPFAALMTKVTTNVTAGRLTEAHVHAALAEHGLQPGQIGHLAARHDLAALVSARLDHYLAGGA